MNNLISSLLLSENRNAQAGTLRYVYSVQTVNNLISSLLLSENRNAQAGTLRYVYKSTDCEQPDQ